MVTRLTGPTLAVLEQFLAHPDEPRYGLELGAQTELPSGTIHPILARLEAVGWVRSEWERVDPAAAGRPRRRWYRLTPEGREAAEAALARARARRSRLAARLNAAEGLA